MKKRKIFGKNGRGSTLVICSLLLASAAIRVGGEAGKAVAVESSLPAVPAGVSHADAAEARVDREGIQQMLAAFQEREQRIERLERQLEVRKKALAVADQEVSRRLAALESAEDSLRSVLAIADSAAEDDLARLTSVYENMKPKDAAALFEEMEPVFAAGFLGRMRPDAAAEVMAGLAPKTAYTISVILAGRNAQAPKR
jgi:flagellar motility protein MotE (MotC chaperone)